MNTKSEKHPHLHSDNENRAVINRLSRAIGHMQSVKRMVEDGRDCSEILIQLAAVKSAINNASKVVIKNHMNHCIKQAFLQGEQEQIDMLTTAIDKLI